MSSDLQQRVESVKRKAGLIVERIKMLERSQAEHLRQIDELTRKVTDLECKLEKAYLDLEYMAMLSTLAPTKAKAMQMRERLVRLVCEIDKCITEIND